MKATTQTTHEKYEDHINRFRTRAFLERDFSAIDECLTIDFIDHFAPPGDPPGREGVKKRFGLAAHAFKTLRVEVIHSMVQGPVVMQSIRIHMKHTGNFMGVPPSNREIAIGGFDAFEFRGEKLCGHWGVYDVSRIPDLLGIAQPLDRSASWSSMWNNEAVSA